MGARFAPLTSSMKCRLEVVVLPVVGGDLRPFLEALVQVLVLVYVLLLELVLVLVSVGF
jgi:hypothetical protein